MNLEWQPLKENATVRIIAPSSKIEAGWEELKKSCDFLRSLKLNPVYSKNIFSDTQDARLEFYNFANTDEKRYEDFTNALQSDAEAIWCFRGGYGSDRVLRRAVKNHFTPRGNPKLFIGFSDITNLHSYLNSQWKWCTLHAASLRQFGRNTIVEEDVEVTKEIIFGKRREINLDLSPMNESARKNGEVKSEISGGNLTVIQCAIGTAWQIPIKNKILLFEEVDEAPYRVARMFQHFLASNLLQEAQGVLLGDFIPKRPDAKIEETDSTAMEVVLQEFADQCPIPVLRYHGIGHGKRNYPIPLGTATRLTLGDKATLVAATGALIK
jgi:muramoyltetrapeptide carboxypeptidase